MTTQMTSQTKSNRLPVLKIKWLSVWIASSLFYETNSSRRPSRMMESSATRACKTRDLAKNSTRSRKKSDPMSRKTQAPNQINMIPDSVLHSNEKRTHHWWFRIGDKVRIKTLNKSALVIGFNYWSSNWIYVESIKWRLVCTTDNLEMITRIEDQEHANHILHAIKFNS